MSIPGEKAENIIPEKNNFRRHVSKNLSEFLDNTSIHGFKYLVGNDRTMLEKCLWFIVLFGQNPVRLWEIPFPAVTVCTDSNFNKESNHTFSYINNNMEWEKGNSSTFCDAFENSGYPYETEFELVDFFEGQKWEKYLLGTAVFPKQFLESYYFWKVQFSPFLTQLGVCYSFNMLDKKNILHKMTYVPSAFGNQNNISYWSFDQNYRKTNKTVYPHRFKTIENGLRIRLNSELNKLVCLGSNKYIIQLHHPGEIPTLKSRILIEPNKFYSILIKPDITITSDSLKTYSFSRKKCFFSNERYLQFYKIYTQENCRLECEANYTLRDCGCVRSDLPHNKTTKLCGIYSHNNIRCMTKSKNVMDDLESGLSENYLDLPLRNCLPSYNAIVYNSEISVSDSLFTMTHVSIQFKDAEFNVLERQELFGDVNFWASCGRVLGLFIGLSVVSLVEIVYYLFFRLLYNLCRRLSTVLILFLFRV